MASVGYEADDWQITFKYDEKVNKWRLKVASDKLDITYRFWFTNEQARDILKQLTAGIEQ